MLTSRTFFDLVTLTYELDPDFLRLDLHAKIQVCMSVRLAVRVVTDTQTDRQTDRHTMSKLLYTRHVTDVRCKMKSVNIRPISELFKVSLFNL